MKALCKKDTYIKLKYDLQNHPDKWLSRLVFLLGPWACLWMVETLNQNNVFKDLEAWQVLMNLIWYYSLFVVCRLLLGRNRRAAALGTILSFGAGLVNHYILRFRGRILFPADLAGWRTAANVAQGFDYSMDWYIAQALILLTCYLFLVWACVPQKKRARVKPLYSVIVWGLLIGYGVSFFCTDMLPNLGIYTQQWVTQRNGFLLNFTVAMRYSSVDKPKGYSQKAVLELMEQYPAVEGDPSVKRPVNIVAIMNESLGDYSIFDSFDCGEDVMPFLHSIKDNAVTGWMYSPVTGGGTASVEFEYLTGFSTIFQPPHTVAYQLYVEKNMPSLAGLAGTQGYETTAFHPYDRSGWNRVLAYDYLSFDHQLYQEDVPEPWIIRKYISDKSDYEMIYRSTQQEDATFFFNVTMQNHSGYAQGWNNLAHSVELPGNLRKADPTAEQYFALAAESDKALKELLDYYASCEEPTLVVVFGDHQPPLKNAFYEELYGKKLDERTTEEVMQQYAVPFFIWANYDIPEQENVVLSPNYLGVLTAQMAGLPLTGYMNFLSQMYEELPVITPVGLITGEGEVRKKTELNEAQKEWLRKYELLNYCGMISLFDQARPMFCFHPEKK